jgi:hypothetical protein
MKKYLVFRNRDGRKSSWEFDTAADVAKFLHGENPRFYTVYIQIEGLELAQSESKIGEQLFYVACEADLNL